MDPGVEVFLTFDENFAIESETAGNECYDFVSVRKTGTNIRPKCQPIGGAHLDGESSYGQTL